MIILNYQWGRNAAATGPRLGGRPGIYRARNNVTGQINRVVPWDVIIHSVPVPLPVPELPPLLSWAKQSMGILTFRGCSGTGTGTGTENAKCIRIKINPPLTGHSRSWLGKTGSRHPAYVVMREADYAGLLSELAASRLAASLADLAAGRVRRGTADTLMTELGLAQP